MVFQEYNTTVKWLDWQTDIAYWIFFPKKAQNINFPVVQLLILMTNFVQKLQHNTTKKYDCNKSFFCMKNNYYNIIWNWEN